MSKLSDPLKRLINAASARPNTTPAPSGIKSVYARIASEAAKNKVGAPAWLTLSTAATTTMNSPESLVELWKVAQDAHSSTSAVEHAELMREVGLKCITLNGVARTINVLGGFRAGLPQEITSQMSTTRARHLDTTSTSNIFTRGSAAWKSFYQPFDSKLADKLAQSHPDMPEYIIGAHYGSLLSPQGVGHVGRVLTSVLAVACLRAQTGVGPQLTSHVFGLRKAYGDGTAAAEKEVEGGEWLASNEGGIWMIESVDRITAAIAGGEGSNFAPGAIKAKL